MSEQLPPPSRFGPPTSLYILWNKDKDIIYIGITSRGMGRMGQHSVRAWWGEVVGCRFFHFGTRHEARLAEQRAIRRYRPVHNRTGKPTLCSNCDMNNAQTGGRCSTCYSYHRRTGRERPMELALKAAERWDAD